MAITIDDLEALRRRLTELPRNQPKAVSKQEAVALLARELGTARRRGYSPEELAQMFSQQGITINAATLRGYLRRNGRNRSRPGGKNGQEEIEAIEATSHPTRTDSPTTAPIPPAPAASGARSTPTKPKESTAASAIEVPSTARANDGTAAGPR